MKCSATGMLKFLKRSTTAWSPDTPDVNRTVNCVVMPDLIRHPENRKEQQAATDSSYEKCIVDDKKNTFFLGICAVRYVFLQCRCTAPQRSVEKTAPRPGIFAAFRVTVLPGAGGAVALKTGDVRQLPGVFIINTEAHHC